MSENEWTKILGWPGYRVYRSEIDEGAKRLRLWVRRKRENRKLECSGCGQRIGKVAEVYEREVRDLPWWEYRTTVVIELYRVRCPSTVLSTSIKRWPTDVSYGPISCGSTTAMGQPWDALLGEKCQPGPQPQSTMSLSSSQFSH